MKQLLKLIALSICLSLVFSLASCTDFGVGETEEALKEYFSKVYVLSDSGSKQYSISHFNGDIELEDVDIPVVIPHDEYCYIGFRVADEYTVSLSEFVFFAKTEAGSGVLDLEFYIVDKMPTSIKDSDGSDVMISVTDSEESSVEETEPIVEPDTETNTETDTESNTETDENIREEDLFLSDNRFYSAKFAVSEEWDSVLLQFGDEKTVKGGEYVIVRIKNNCYSASGDETYQSIAFTFNYLLFYINSAHK